MVLPVGGRKPGIPDRTGFELNTIVGGFDDFKNNVTANDIYVPSGGNIQGAIDEAAGSRRVILAPGVFDIDTTLLMRSAHDNLHLEALIPGKTVLRIDDDATAFASTSAPILRSQTPSATYSETGLSSTVAAGTTEYTLSNASDVSVGDLIFLRRETVDIPNQGEIRKIIAINGNTVRFDYPLYRESLDGTTWRLDVYSPRTATVKGIVFDLGNHDAGHAGITFHRLAGVLVEDCQFITGGQHGAYAFSSHTVTYRRCHAEDMDKRTNPWTPERTGETEIAASRSGVGMGEGYGLAYEAVNVVIENCTFRRNRHHISGGGTDYCSAHVRYINCHGTEDLQGAYDFHENVDYGVIEDTCTAARGWAGGWLRGRNLVDRGRYADMASEGSRIFGYPQDVTVDTVTFRCGYHARILPSISEVHRITIRGTCHTPQIWAFHTDEDHTYTDLVIDLTINGGNWNVRPEGTFRHLRISGRWRGPHAYSGTGLSTTPVWVRAADAAGAASYVTIENIDVDSANTSIGSTVVLGEVATSAALADGTYANVVVNNVTVETGTGSSFGSTNFVLIRNNGDASPSTVTGRFERTNMWRSGVEVTIS